MISSAFTDMRLRQKSVVIYLFIFREQPLYLLSAHGNLCMDIEKSCPREYVLGLWPTREAWAMANLIPIDFYAEGKPNTIYP